MARVFITGSADGLGRAAAQTLLNDGHEVVVHARNRDRLRAVRDLLDRGAAAVVGDLSDLEETRHVARDVNRLGRMDAVIHNAGVYTGPHILPVNIVVPYLLTALIDRPQRLIYLSSSEHRSGRKWADPVRPTICGSATSPRSGSPPARIPRRAPLAATGITSAGPSRIPPSVTGGSRTNCSRTWLASPPRASSDSCRIALSWSCETVVATGDLLGQAHVSTMLSMHKHS